MYQAVTVTFARHTHYGTLVPGGVLVYATQYASGAVLGAHAWLLQGVAAKRIKPMVRAAVPAAVAAVLFA